MSADWKYIYSDELQQKVAINRNGWVFTQDGTKYSPREVQALRVIGGIAKEVHMIKRMFGGTIMEQNK